MKRFGKQYWKQIIGCIVLVILCPLFMDWFIIGNNIPSNIDNNVWVGFLGSYFGSIVGAIVTLAGVILTIRFTERENNKVRMEQIKKEQQEQDKEIHMMVASLLYDVTACGESFLDDIDLSDQTYTLFYKAEKGMLKNARKFALYSEMRAIATNRPQLDSSSVFEAVSDYANSLVDLANAVSEKVNTRITPLCEKEKDDVARQLEELRKPVEKALLDYASNITQSDSCNTSLP